MLDIRFYVWYNTNINKSKENDKYEITFRD